MAQTKTPRVVAALKVREVSPRSPTLPTPSAMQLSAQGDSIDAHVERALNYLQAERIFDLRHELEWLTKQPSQRLQTRAKILFDLLASLKLAMYRPSYEYHPPADTRISLRAPFLDPHKGAPAPSRKNLERQLQLAAQGLSEHKFGSVGQAVASVRRYVEHEKQDLHKRQQGLFSLAFGMMDKVTQVLKGPQVSSLYHALQRSSSWKNVQHASQSAGFVRVLSLPEAPDERMAQRWEMLDPPWGPRPDARWLFARQTQSYILTRPKASKLRVQVFCRPHESRSADSAPAKVDLMVDDQRVASLAVQRTAMAEHELNLYAGQHVLGVLGRHLQGKPCAVLVQEHRHEKWRSLAARQPQTWFQSVPQRPAGFQVRGPTTLRVDLRGFVRDRSRSMNATLVHRTPTGRVFAQKVSAGAKVDPHAQMEHAPQLKLTAPHRVTLLLTEPGLHEFSLDSPRGELLVLAKTRRFEGFVPTIDRLAGLHSTLESKLAPSAPKQAVALQPKFPPSGISRPVDPPSDDRASMALFGAKARFGVEQDTEFEQVRSRWSSSAQALATKALMPKRLWAGLSAGISSENWARPIGSMTASLWAQSSGQRFRFQLKAMAHTQHLERWGASFGVSARMWASLAALLARMERWDLRPSVALVARHISQGARSIAQSSRTAQLHSRVFRQYTLDHPLSLRSGAELQWRRFYDFRAALGHEFWSNANLWSLDRMRSWIRIWGMLDRFRGHPARWWNFGVRYRATYAFVDRLREHPFLRQALQAHLGVSWRVSGQRRWSLSLVDALVFQQQGFAGNRAMLRLNVEHDGPLPLKHRPFPMTYGIQELRTRWWASTQSEAQKEPVR